MRIFDFVLRVALKISLLKFGLVESWYFKIG